MHTATRTRRVAVAVLVAVSSFTLASAAAALTQRTVPTAREAWYQVSPLASDEEACVLPTGCAAAPVQLFPEHTLHVGVTAGRDSARTFLTLDTTVLPTGARIAGGTLHLPLADAEAGTLRPDAAEFVACSVTARFEEVSGGSPDDQPPFNCDTNSPATFDDKADPAEFAVDLAPLAATLSRRGTGIALVPRQAAEEQPDTWRVVFSGKERDAEDAKPITADVQYELATKPAEAAAADPPDEAPPASQPHRPAEVPDVGAPSAGPRDAAFESVPLNPESVEGSGPIAPLGGVAPEAPAVSAEPPLAAGGDAVAAPAPVAATAPWPYMYPAVWFAPLVLAAVAAGLAQSLTTEMPVPGAADGRRRDVLGRVIAALEALRTPAPDQTAGRPA